MFLGKQLLVPPFTLIIMKSMELRVNHILRGLKTISETALVLGLVTLKDLTLPTQNSTTIKTPLKVCVCASLIGGFVIH